MNNLQTVTTADPFIEGEMELSHAIRMQKASNWSQAANACSLARDYFSLALLSPDIQAVPSLASVIEMKLLKISKILKKLNNTYSR